MYLTQLQRIYNTMLMISTRGEDTLLMADCLRALQKFAQDAQKEQDEAKQETPKAEETK